jgi:hypothetical protein
MFVESSDWVFSILRGVLWVFEEPSGVYVVVVGLLSLRLQLLCLLW